MGPCHRTMSGSLALRLLAVFVLLQAVTAGRRLHQRAHRLLIAPGNVERSSPLLRNAARHQTDSALMISRWRCSRSLAVPQHLHGLSRGCDRHDVVPGRLCNDAVCLSTAAGACTATQRYLSSFACAASGLRRSCAAIHQSAPVLTGASSSRGWRATASNALTSVHLALT